MRHILRSQQFERSFLERLFAEADHFAAVFRSGAVEQEIGNLLFGKMLFTIFYEPSDFAKEGKVAYRMRA